MCPSSTISIFFYSVIFLNKISSFSFFEKNSMNALTSLSISVKETCQQNFNPLCVQLEFCHTLHFPILPDMNIVRGFIEELAHQELFK